MLSSYFLSDDPNQPPRGDVRLALVERTGAAIGRGEADASHRRAA